MNREEKYLKELMQELPREEAPEGITQLIMQKIERKHQFVLVPKLAFWDTLGFWIFVVIAIAEAWLLWTHRNFASFEYARVFLRGVMQKFYEFTTLHDMKSLAFYALLLFGLGIYLWIEEKSQSRYKLSA